LAEIRPISKTFYKLSCFLYNSTSTHFLKMFNLVKKIFWFYVDGFRSMTVGRKLWIIILIKLFIMFGILKLFFFKDYLGSRFSSDEEKATYVIKELTK